LDAPLTSDDIIEPKNMRIYQSFQVLRVSFLKATAYIGTPNLVVYFNKSN